MTPPRHLFRVEWMQGFGYPEVYERRHTARNYVRADDAAHMVAVIKALPSHHSLIAVWHGTCDWSEVPESMLPDVPQPRALELVKESTGE